MCTVTYVARGKKAILTSNRDEHRDRPASLPPASYLIGQKHITFPKDPKAGGTWFAADDLGNVAVLLNGALLAHEPALQYRKSRGLVLLDIIAEISPRSCWENYDLQGIEPFTIILLEQQSLFQLRWDGEKKESMQLPAADDHIWSSCTLYAPDIQQERILWFDQFRKQNPEADMEDMKHFHSQTARENPDNGLIINRDSGVKTFSITQAVVEDNQAEMFHYDLLKEKQLSHSFITV
jgi:hypothetical protein